MYFYHPHIGDKLDQKISGNVSAYTRHEDGKVSKIDFDCIFSNFPHIGEAIFSRLKDQDLVSSRLVSKSWKYFFDDQKFYWIRIIQRFLVQRNWEEFKFAWGRILKTFKFEDIKEIVEITKEYCKTDSRLSQIKVKKQSKIVKILKY